MHSPPFARHFVLVILLSVPLTAQEGGTGGPLDFDVAPQSLGSALRELADQARMPGPIWMDR